jgi:membrane protein
MNIYLKQADFEFASQESAKLSYFMLMSLFPLIYLIIIVLGFFGQNNINLFSKLDFVLPQSTYNLIIDFINSIPKGTISTIGLSLLFLLWSGSKGISSYINLINLKFRKTKPIGIENRMAAIIYIFMLVFIILLDSIITQYINLYIDLVKVYFPSFSNKIAILLFSKSIINTIFLFIFILYLNYKALDFKINKLLVGSTLSTVFLLIIKFIFSNFNQYLLKLSIVYGSLTTIFIFIFWLYLANYSILIGIMINDIKNGKTT